MYQIFAHYYDEMMSQVAYEEWAEYVHKQIKKYGNEGELLVDLGCGSGSMSLLMAQRGYEVIGTDLSSDMLMEAKSKRSHKKIMYIQQDMRELDLYGSVDTVISICDSLNYILKIEELKTVFEKVYYFLNSGGVFVFDLNTAYKFAELIGDETFVYNYDAYTCVWENYYDEKERIHEYALTFFVKEDQHYNKYQETHYEKAYDIGAIKMLLEETGFEICHINGDMNQSDIESAGKVYFTARKR